VPTSLDCCGVMESLPGVTSRKIVLILHPNSRFSISHQQPARRDGKRFPAGKLTMLDAAVLGSV